MIVLWQYRLCDVASSYVYRCRPTQKINNDDRPRLRHIGLSELGAYLYTLQSNY